MVADMSRPTLQLKDVVYIDTSSYFPVVQMRSNYINKQVAIRRADPNPNKFVMAPDVVPPGVVVVGAGAGSETTGAATVAVMLEANALVASFDASSVSIVVLNAAGVNAALLPVVLATITACAASAAAAGKVVTNTDVTPPLPDSLRVAPDNRRLEARAPL